MGSKSSPPPAPNYTQAAQATSAGNLAMAREQQAANMVNQNTPYGSLSYSANPSSQDINGNPTYTATQTLSPQEQQLFNQTTGLSSGLLNTAQSGLDYANQTLAKPGVDLNSLPSTGINPGQQYQNAMMQQLQPQIDRQQEQLNTSLANQGIPIGSEAWKNAQQQQSQNINNLLATTTTTGMNMGLNANNQAFQQQAYNQMQPINVINALRTGSQVQNPNYVNTPTQAQVAGPDLLGAAQAQYQGALNTTNAQNAQSAGLFGGLGTLGAAAMMSPAGTFSGPAGLFAMSDSRLKKNIRRLGRIRGINWYVFSYLWDDVRHVGVMAQEVLTRYPEAVKRHSTGYYMVDYSRLGGNHGL